MSAERTSGYPQIAIYARDGSLRRRIDCIPTTRPDAYLANEPLDAAGDEAVVIAFDPRVLDDEQLFKDLRAAH